MLGEDLLVGLEPALFSNDLFLQGLQPASAHFPEVSAASPMAHWAGPLCLMLAG